MDNKVIGGYKDDGTFDRLWLRVNDIDYEIPKINIESYMTMNAVFSEFVGRIRVEGFKPAE